MARSHYRSAYVIALAAAASCAITFSGANAGARPSEPARARTQAPAADGDVHASMQCDRAMEPGRVRCTVEVRIEGGRTLSWADVEILALPDFASALKGRIGPQDALARDASSTKWALGLVARRAGQGEARGRVRLVACEGKRCVPLTVEIRAQITVGG
jgi:hypothetical protein